MDSTPARDRVDRYFEEQGILVHHGIKGMRWGVRKSVSSSGGSGNSSETAKAAPKKTSAPSGPPTVSKKTGRITAAPAHASAPSAGKTTHHTMSDEELRKAISRIDMERRYVQLTKAPPGKREAAIKFVSDLMLDIGKQQAKAVLTSVATSQVNKQLTKAGLPTAKAKKHKE